MLEPQREDRLRDLRRAAARRAPAGCAALEQQLRDLLGDRRAAFDDAARSARLRRSARAMRDRIDARDASRSAGPRPRSSPPTSDRRQRRPRRAASLRVPSPEQRLVERHAVAIDDDRGRARRRVEQLVEQRPDGGSDGAAAAARRARSPPRDDAPRRDRRASMRGRVRARRRRRAARAVQPSSLLRPRSSPSPSGRTPPARTSLRRAPARCGTCRRSWRGRCRELVVAFAEPRREQLHAVVVPLDVVEPAALPPRRPVTARPSP